MTFRSVTYIAAAALAAIAFVAAFTLSWTTTQMHALTTSMTSNLDGVRASEEIEIYLLRHEQAATRPHLDAQRERLTAEAESNVRRWYEVARQSIGSEEEAAIVTALGDDLAHYFDRFHVLGAQDPNAAAASLGPLLDAAYARTDALLQVNLAQADHAAERSGYWDRIADRLGFGIGFALIMIVVVIIIGADLLVIRPLVRLRGDVARYATGAGDTRSLERGPSEVSQLARIFNEMADALERQRQNRLEFIAGVAHDLRNPLGALKMALYNIRRDPQQAPGERLSGTLRLVARQVDVLETMISDLLDGARIESGRLELRPGEHDLCEIVAHAVDLFRAVSTRHELVEEHAVSHLALPCDGARIEQVVNNLVSNAIKYSPAGGRVVVRVARDADAAIVSVSDEGLGIAPGESDRIFEPFRRSGSSRTAIPGVGLGLSVARRIVEAHGGRIEVQSTPGHGSTFTVRLPMPSADAHDVAAASPLRSAAAPPG